MLDNIRNIYCVGRNYRLHAEELGNAVPDKPMIFSKPTHALVAMDGREIGLPVNQGEIHHEAELVVHLARAYEPGAQLNDLIDRMALGIDFTLRDVQSELKKKGHPWLLAKGFRGSAPLTRFIDFPGAERITELDFTLTNNGKEVQRGNAKDMIFSLQHIIEYCAVHFGLGAGDIIFTGTPAGVGPVADGDRLQLNWGGELLGESTVRLR
jgi:fumarylpyruvate hydrolase